MSGNEAQTFCLGDWLVEPEVGRVSRGEESATLRPREMDLLVYFSRHPGEVLHTDDLIREVWRGVHVTNDSLYFSISQLRKILDRGSAGDSVIETLPKRGYRLTADVLPVSVEHSTESEETSNESGTTTRTVELTPECNESRENDSAAHNHRFTMIRRVGSVIFAVSIMALGYLFWESRYDEPRVPDNVSSQTQTQTENLESEPVRIAVLPFANLSDDPEQEYFADGVTEELLYRLARIGRLAVISRTSAFAFKNKDVPISEIAESLGVNYILEGAIRRSQDRFRITAQLIQVDTNTHLWSERYDRDIDSIFELQDELSTSIASALELNLLGPANPDSGRDLVIPEAYDLYLYGLNEFEFSTLESTARAAEYFKAALELDPSFVRARAALGWTLAGRVTNGVLPTDEYVPMIREHIRRGLGMDPGNAGLVGLEGQLEYIGGDLERAEQLFRRALELDPPYYSIDFFYPLVLQVRGKLEEAQEFVRQALKTDPLNIRAGLILAHLFSENGEYEAFFETTSKLKSIAPENLYPIFNEGYVRVVYLGDLANGIRDFEMAVRIDPNDYEIISMLAITYHDIGESGLADEWAERAVILSPEATTVQAAIAYGFAHRGDLGRARQISLQALSDHFHFDRWWGGFITMRLAVDELIAQGNGQRAVQMILEAEPDWAAFRNQSPTEAPHLSDGPGYYNSGAVRITDYLPDFARALRAADDNVGANNVLAHHERFLAWRRERGYTVWEVNLAELHAMRGHIDEALDALERAERDGTLYAYIDHTLFRNQIFDEFREKSRFKELHKRVNKEINRQRAELNLLRIAGFGFAGYRSKLVARRLLR